MKKVDITQFETTAEELREKGVLFIPHTGYANPATERERERLWREHLKKGRRDQDLTLSHQSA